MILAIRNDLKMQKGKVAAQCGHASVGAYAKALVDRPKTVKRWLRYGKNLLNKTILFYNSFFISSGGTKITVKIDTEQELLDLEKAAKAQDVLSCIVRDAGQTQVAPGSRTVIAIGPAPKSVLDKITGHLKLY